MELKMDIAALQDFLETAFPQVGDTLSVLSITQDGLCVQLRVDATHLRPGGTVSGPSMFLLVDVAVYLAILARIGPVALTVTTNCTIDFMRKPASGTDLTCEVRILKIGRALAVCDALVYSAGQDAPVARANLTYAIPPK